MSLIGGGKGGLVRYLLPDRSSCKFGFGQIRANEIQISVKEKGPGCEQTVRAVGY